MTLQEITLEQIIELHDYSIERFGGSNGIRDKGALACRYCQSVRYVWWRGFVSDCI